MSRLVGREDHNPPTAARRCSNSVLPAEQSQELLLFGNGDSLGAMYMV